MKHLFITVILLSFALGAQAQMWVKPNGRIGIGNQFPVAKLQVNGLASMSNPSIAIFDSTGTDNAGILQFRRVSGTSNHISLRGNVAPPVNGIGSGLDMFFSNTLILKIEAGANANHHLWYNAKTGSFRSGFLGTGAVADYSVAMGYNNSATAISAIALGGGNGANAGRAIALGSTNNVNGESSIGLGRDNYTTGHASLAAGYGCATSDSSSIALGDLAISSGRTSLATGQGTVASGDYSTAMGFLSTASGEHATTIGRNTSAVGSHSLAMGYYSTATGAFSRAIGNSNNTNADFSTAIGNYNTTQGLGSTAIGYGNQSIGAFSISAGYNTIASGENTFTTNNGTQATGTSAFASGEITRAVGTGSSSFGYNTVARSYISAAFGTNNDSITTSDPVGWITTDPLFMIGNGISHTERNNAFTVYKNGTILANHTSTVTTDPGALPLPRSGEGTRMMWIPEKSAFRVGTITGTEWDAANIGAWSVAMGQNVKASALNAIAFGRQTQATGQRSTAFGYNCIASGHGSTACGDGSVASGTVAIATGRGTEASAPFAASLNYFTKATGESSTAMGDRTVAQGNNSVAMSRGTIARSYASVAIGRFNDPYSGSSMNTWVSTDPVFIIGNGIDSLLRSNALVVFKNGNTDVHGYTRLGHSGEGAPRIKTKKLTGTAANTYNGSVSIGHGVTTDKILSVNVLVEWNTGANQYAPPEYSPSLNLRYNFYINGPDIVIQNNTPNGDCLICSKTVKVLITYEE